MPETNIETFDVTWQTYGEPLLSFGLYNRSAVNGIGLVSRGFLWETQDIWIDTTLAAPITTTWAVGSSVSSTNWTNSQFGIFGDSQN